MWHDWDVDSWKDSFGWVSEDKPYGNILISTLYFPDAFPELYWWPEGPFQVHPRYRGGRSNKIQWIWWEDVPEAGGKYVWSKADLKLDWWTRDKKDTLTSYVDLHVKLSTTQGSCSLSRDENMTRGCTSSGCLWIIVTENADCMFVLVWLN